MEKDEQPEFSTINRKTLKAYIPTIKPKIMDIVLNINEELINLCKEYQNMGLVGDFEYMIYQRKLQSNLKYMSTVADYYLNPTANEPDFSINVQGEKPKHLIQLLEQAKIEHKAYVNAWKELHLERSKEAKRTLDEADKAALLSLKQTVPCNKIVQIVCEPHDEINFDYLKDGDKDMYIPQPPFKLPTGVVLPSYK
ncbi:hypothetical protein AYI68_g3194 [Smittium mucronatum]|uniref:SS18 N-terminal domain-containing protein n=1 Tax=Smittium mucronatum TaxID=133383 RepID=A0A1R0H0M6_9FUNG|nr:hypothetical protein AYI68_g3194 [Smittium mucronatum]